MDYWAFDIEDRIAVVSPKASAPKSLTLAAVAELSEALNTLGDLQLDGRTCRDRWQR